jgi:hypothetical protein
MASITYTPYTATEDYLKQAQQEAIAAQQAATAANLVGLDTQRQQTNQTYDKNAQQLYQNLLSNQRGLANQNQAGGLFNSGYSETSNVNLMNNYGTNLNASELQRQQQLQRIADTQQKYQLQGQADLANINASYASQIGTLKQQQEQQAEALKQQAIANAYTAAEYGDYSQLDALGIDSSYIRAYNNSKLQQAQASAASAAKSATKTRTLDPVKAEQGYQEAVAFIDIYANKSGWSAAQMLQKLNSIKALYINLYGQDFWDSFYDTIIANYPGMSGYSAPSAASPALTVSQFVSNTRGLLEAGKFSSEDELAEYISDTGYSADQKAEIMKTLVKYLS